MINKIIIIAAMKEPPDIQIFPETLKNLEDIAIVTNRTANISLTLTVCKYLRI